MPYLGQSPSKGDENNFKILDDISSYTLTFDGSDSSVVSAANDTITSLTHRFVQGQRVTYNNGGGSNIAGLTSGTVYYVIKHDHHNIKLATSASNAANGTAVNITNVGGGASHTINVAFDGVNTKFKATHTNGQKAKITRSAQLVISINGVIQQPHDTATPSTGFGFDLDGTIVFSQAPVAGDEYWAHVLTNNNVTFDISDNDVDNFTGNGSTVSFNLSKTPPDNRNVLVTIDGVVQYPNDPDGTVRAYNVVENVLTFTVAPDANVQIQVRHIGFAGSTTSGVTNFYGRTGSVVLTNSDNIVANNAEFAGNLTVQGTMTTLDTKVTEVDQLEVAANNTTVGVAITQSGTGDILNLYDGSTEVFSVTDGGNTFLTGSLTSTGSHLRVVDKNNGGQILIGNNNDLVLKHESNNSYIAHNGSGDLYLETLGSSEDIYVRSTGTQRFSTAGVERVQIASNGRVGILTVTPEARLDVYDTSGLGILSRSAATQATDTNKALKVRNNSTTDTFNVSYKGQGYFAGKVGIGTVTPGRELTIYSPDSGSTYLNLTNATTGAGSNSGFALGLGGDEVARIWQYGASQMEFGTNSTQHMTLASTGQLGIGTDFDTATTSKKLTLVLDSVGDGIHIGNKESLYPAASTGYSDLRFTFRDYLTGGFTNGGEAIVRGYSEHAYATQRRTALIFMTSSSATSGNATGDATEKFRITSYGQLEQKAYGGYNKLITQRTDAAGSNNDIFFQLLARNTGGIDVGSLSFQRESAADDAYLAFNTRNTGGSLGERLRITSTGTVGINCTPLAFPLEVKQQSANGGALRLRDASATYRYLDFDVTGALTQITARSNNSHGSISIGTTDQFGRTNQLYIKGGANASVGIGTDNPATGLHISGDGAGQNTIRIDSSTTAISFNNHSEFMGYIGNDSGKLFINAGGTERTLSLRTVGTERLRINSNGRVGIHTTDINAQLEIGNVTGGNMNATGIQVNRPHSLGLKNGILVYADGGYNNSASYRTAAFKAVGTSGIAFGVSTDQGSNGLGGTLNALINFDGSAYFADDVGIGQASSTDPWGATGNVNTGVRLVNGSTDYAIMANSNSIVAILNRTNTAGVIAEYKYNANVVGSVITDGTNLELSSGATTKISAGGGVRLNIESGGNVRISDEHLRFDTSGKGIIFGINGGSDRPSIIGSYTSSSNNQMVFNTVGTEKLKIDASAIYVKSGFPLAFLASSGPTPNIKSSGTNNQDLVLTTGSGNPTRMQIAANGQVCIGSGFVGGGGHLTIRGGGVNTYATQDLQYVGTPSNGTTLSQIRFSANTSGGSVIQGARIQANADAAWSTTGDAPTRLQFYTAPDGSATSLSRLTITAGGTVYAARSGANHPTQSTLTPELQTSSYVVGPMFYWPLRGLTSGYDADGPGHIIMSSSNNTINFMEPEASNGYNSIFQAGFFANYSQPWSNTASNTKNEDISANRVRVWLRVKRHDGSSHTGVTVKFNLRTYHYSPGWTDHTQWDWTGMDSARGFRWVVSPWLATGDFSNWADVPGLGLKYDENGNTGYTVMIQNNMMMQFAYFV